MIADLFAPQRALDRVSRLVNGWLRHEDAARARLGELAGRCVEIRLMHLPARLVLAVDGDGILLATQSAGAADVVVEGTLADLVAMARAHRAGAAVPSGSVRIEGDLATVRRFAAAFDELAFDWEGELARAIGDIPARQVARVVSGALAFLRRVRHSAARDVGAYLNEESGVLAAPEEIGRLAADALRLDMAVERAAARVRRLEARRRR